MNVVNQDVGPAVMVVVDRRAVIRLDLQIGLLLEDGIVLAVVVVLRIGDDGALERSRPSVAGRQPAVGRDRPVGGGDARCGPPPPRARWGRRDRRARRPSRPASSARRAASAAPGWAWRWARSPALRRTSERSSGACSSHPGALADVPEHGAPGGRARLVREAILAHRRVTRAEHGDGLELLRALERHAPREERPPVSGSALGSYGNCTVRLGRTL